MGTTFWGSTLMTHREKEIFALIVDGVSRSQIAEKLRLTESEVKAHVTDIIDKLAQRLRV